MMELTRIAAGLGVGGQSVAHLDLRANRGMAKSSKLVAARKGRVLLVRRRRDRLWMFPGGRKRSGENERACLRREIKVELPKLKVGPLKLWKEVKGKNRQSGRKMSDAIFLAKKPFGQLKIGDKKEIDRAIWCKPHGVRLTPTSPYIVPQTRRSPSLSASAMVRHHWLQLCPRSESG